MSDSKSRQDRLREKIERLHGLQRMQFGQRGFLRPQIIELLGEQPMNGVDIMDKLQERSRGWYRPSPGSIYPLLEQIEKEGLIAKNKDGKYELTSAFEAAGGGGELSSVVSSMESYVSYLEDIKRANPARLARFGDRLDKVARRLDDLNGSRPGKGD